MKSLNLPAAFITRIAAFDGGPAWLESLPGLLERAAEHWSLTLGPPFELSYNYVCPAERADGSRVVLKIGLPNDELDSEMAALQLYAGEGCALLLDTLPEIGAFLVERLEPGSMLSEILDDDEATRIAARVMQQLWKPAPESGPFPTTKKWSFGLARLWETFDDGTGPYPQALVEKAEALFAELHASAGPPVLLHGDLHHFNILRAERDPWLAIDPKGITGEAEYEVGALLRNPDNHQLDDAALKQRTERRIAILEEMLGFDRGRMRGWCIAQAVLSAWWSYEDEGEVGEAALRLAEIL